LLRGLFASHSTQNDFDPCITDSDHAALRDGLKMLLESAVKLLLARSGIVPGNGIRA